MAKYLQGVKKKGSNVSVPADDMDDIPLPPPPARDVSDPLEEPGRAKQAQWDWESLGKKLTPAERRGARFSSQLPVRAGERIGYDKSEMDRFGKGPPKKLLPNPYTTRDYLGRGSQPYEFDDYESKGKKK